MSESLVRQAVVGDTNPDAQTAEAIGKAAHRMEEIAGEMAAAKATDTARFEALGAELAKQSDILSGLKAKHDEEVRDAALEEAQANAKAALEMASGLRAPSKASHIGTGRVLVPSMSGYQRGSFIAAIETLNSRDAFDDERRAAKATLDALGSMYLTPEQAGSKATLGATDATGGWILPNAIVEPLIKTGRFKPGVERLVASRPGMADQYQIDIPFRRASPSRALVAPWGDTKENRNLTYEGYTATLYTIAAIHDVGKQFVRKSRGAAEADVLGELNDAFARGRAYYILNGSGSAEPYGLQTALALGGASGFTTSFSPVATTLAGSIASAIAKAGGALAGRDRTPTGALLDASMYWAMLAQGTDTAGFWFAGQRGGTPEDIDPNTLVSPFGIPVIPDNEIAGTDDLIVGEWDALKVYYGESFRVDSSDVAGERWDKNLVGFRGEQEIGLDARPAVFAGAFETVADITP